MTKTPSAFCFCVELLCTQAALWKKPGTLNTPAGKQIRQPGTCIPWKMFYMKPGLVIKRRYGFVAMETIVVNNGGYGMRFQNLE